MHVNLENKQFLGNIDILVSDSCITNSNYLMIKCYIKKNYNFQDNLLIILIVTIRQIIYSTFNYTRIDRFNRMKTFAFT